MASRSRVSTNTLSDFPANPHENRFSDSNRPNPKDNQRSRSYHGKCVCDICTCGKHSCPPSVSPNKYPKDMRSTSQDDFRAYKPKEIKNANLKLDLKKQPLHLGEAGRVIPDKSEQDQYQTFNQKSYPNHWKKDFDSQQLRYPPSRSAHHQSSDIFPREAPTDNRLSPKPRNQFPIERSPARGIDSTVPAGINSRRRTGAHQTPRRANDTSPDFPLNQPTYTQPHTHFHSSPHSTKHEYDLEEDPSADFSKTRMKTVKPASRRYLDEALPDAETPTRTIRKLDYREEPPALPPRDDEYDSNRMMKSIDPKTLLNSFKYGKRGFPKPQTNQPQLIPQRQAAESPPKQRAEFASRRSNDRRNPVFESQRDYRPSKETAYQEEEYQENRPPNRYTSRGDKEEQSFDFSMKKSDIHNQPLNFQRTPAKDSSYLYSSRPKLTEESVARSPNQTTVPTRVGRGDNLAVDRSLPLDGNTTYKQDHGFEQPKPRSGYGQAEKKPSERDMGDDRDYGKIKTVKYDAVRTSYRDEFKQMPPSFYLKKDCPMQGLPKPPKVITAGKLHVYYDEQENDWD